MNDTKIEFFEDIYSFLDDKLYDEIQLNIERDYKKINIELLPDRKIIETFIGSKREINYIGFDNLSHNSKKGHKKFTSL